MIIIIRNHFLQISSLWADSIIWTVHVFLCDKLSVDLTMFYVNCDKHLSHNIVTPCNYSAAHQISFRAEDFLLCVSSDWYLSSLACKTKFVPPLNIGSLRYFNDNIYSHCDGKCDLFIQSFFYVFNLQMSNTIHRHFCLNLLQISPNDHLFPRSKGG